MNIAKNIFVGGDISVANEAGYGVLFIRRVRVTDVTQADCCEVD